jgi:hypothetical protein
MREKPRVQMSAEVDAQQADAQHEQQPISLDQRVGNGESIS